MKFVIACLLLFCCMDGAAQTAYIPATPGYVINIDSISHAPDKPVPFDQPFTIILKPRSPQNIVKVLAYPTVLDASGKPKVDLPVEKLFGALPKVMGASLVINFPALRPNYHFDFCLQRKLDTAVMDTFLTYTNFIARTLFVNGGTTAAEQDAADVKYNRFVSRIQNTPVAYSAVTSYLYNYLFLFNCAKENTSEELCKGWSVDALFGQELRTAGGTIRLDNVYKAIINLVNAPPNYTRNQDLKADLKALLPLLTGSASKFSDITANAVLRAVADNKLADVLKGLSVLNSGFTAATARPEDIKQRFLNLKTSYKQFAGLQDTVERLSNETAAAGGGALTLERLNTYLRMVLTNLSIAKETVGKNYMDIRNYFQNNPAFYYTEWYVNNTDSFADLQTKSGSLFSPQLGVAFLGVSKNEGGSQVIPKLAIGVNVNFRSINKSLNRADIPHKTLAHYLSGFVGLTFGSFKDNQYNNLFASNSLLFGLNYRVTRSFYLSFGGSAFRQLNANPVINDFHTQLGIYSSLMLDIDIASAASNITSILFK